MANRVKSSEEITAAADELQAKLSALRKEARKMKKLEDQKAAEAQRQNDIAFALEFVECAKRLHFQNSGDSYFDYIARKMRGSEENANVSNMPYVPTQQG